MRPTQVDLQYATLLAKTLPAVIRSEKETEHYTALSELDEKGPKLSAAEQRLAELLTLLIEDFEDRHYGLKPATPIAVLEELTRPMTCNKKTCWMSSAHPASSPRS